MNAAIKIDITKCPVPRLEPSYSKRVKVVDSFDRYLMRESERRERLYNWEKPQPSEGKPRRGVKPSIWTPRRTAELIRLAQAGLRTDEIADRLHLALNQVKPKMAELRKKGEIPPAPPQKNSWRKEENDKLIQLYQQGYTTEKIAATLGRTEHAVGSQIHNLRKRGVDIPARPDVHRKPTYGGGND